MTPSDRRSVGPASGSTGTEAVPPSEFSRPTLSTVVDGDEVRQLVDRTESEIDALRRRLDVARRETAEVERALLEHPSVACLDAMPADLAVTEAAPLTSPPMPPGDSRTVVDRRPAGTAQRTTTATTGAPASSRRRRRTTFGAGNPRAAGAPRRGRRPSGAKGRRHAPRATWISGWAWKVGLALMAAALVLLKVG